MHLPIRSRHSNLGFSIPELLVSAGVAGLILGAVMYAFLFCSRSFVAMGNYMELDKASSLALDNLSRDVREARQLTSFTTNKLTFLDYSSNVLVFEWKANTRKLTRTSSTSTNVLLKECDFLEFHISQRSPLTDGTFGFYSATNTSTLAKMVDVSWRCSRTIFGQKVNTESVQTAKIVMRN